MTDAVAAAAPSETGAAGGAARAARASRRRSAPASRAAHEQAPGEEVAGARLRRAVLAADRPPRARLRRVQRAAARTTSPLEEVAAAQTARDHPLGRPGVGLRDGRAAARPGPARAGRPGDGHLLRHAAARARARRARRAGRGRRVRPLRTARRASRACCWRACRASRPAGCPTATRCTSRRRASPRSPPRPARRWRPSRTASAAIYGIQFHPEVVHTPYGQQILTRFLTEVCGCEPTWSAASIVEEQVAADPRAGRRRQRHLRPLGRRRLLGRGAARAPRRRRPADLRVRRPRPDAQGRGRAGRQDLPRHVQGPARRRRRRAPLPGQAQGRDRARGQAQGDRRRVHPRLRGGGRRSSPDGGDGAASWSRARSTPT